MRTSFPETVFRLRDLSRGGRLAAAALALVLVLPTVIAFFQFAGLWQPTGDTAAMTLRAWDVGTNRTPLTGQPSTSGRYSGDEVHVRHLGPWHFYLMAPFVRVLGSAVGMLAVSALISSSTTLVSVWVVFRRLGPTGGVMAAAAMGAVLFGIGNAALVNPISSNFARMPLLCSAVLAWAVLSGDRKLLPLAAVVISFAVQQHLSVGPTMLVLALVAGVGWWRARPGEPEARRADRHLAPVAAVLALVMWAPLLFQEALGRRGNLSALFRYTLEGGGDTLGVRYAFRQITNVLGYPPMLANTRLTGIDLLEEPSTLTVLSAGALIALVAWAGWRWLRDGDRRGSLVVAISVLLVAGLANGSNVPRGTEEARISFYHWIWPLTVFVLLALGYITADIARLIGRPTSWPRRHGVGVAATGVVVVGMVGVAAVNPGLDRPTNTLRRMSAIYGQEAYESLTDQVMEHERLDGEQSVLVATRGAKMFEGSLNALSLSLAEAGQPVVYSRRFWTYVHDDHIAWEQDEIDAVVLLVVNRAGAEPRSHPGTLAGSYELWDGFDVEAHQTLARQLEEADELVPGPELVQLLDELDPDARSYVELLVDQLETSPSRALLDETIRAALQTYPLASPQLDPDLLARLADNLAEHPVQGDDALSMDVYLIDDPAEIDSFLNEPHSSAPAADLSSQRRG